KDRRGFADGELERGIARGGAENRRHAERTRTERRAADAPIRPVVRELFAADREPQDRERFLHPLVALVQRHAVRAELRLAEAGTGAEEHATFAQLTDPGHFLRQAQRM